MYFQCLSYLQTSTLFPISYWAGLDLFVLQIQTSMCEIILFLCGGNKSFTYELRGAFKIKKCRKLGKVPNRGGGVHRKFKSSQVSVWKSTKRGGSQVSKSSQVWKIMHYFHLIRTLKQKNSYIFALKMGNNTMILQIVIDFVSKVPIFKLFSRFWRGSFHIKMFPSFKLSQVPFRVGMGVVPFQKVPKFKKVRSPVGGGGVIATWELFPSFGAF